MTLGLEKSSDGVSLLLVVVVVGLQVDVGSPAGLEEGRKLDQLVLQQN